MGLKVPFPSPAEQWDSSLFFLFCLSVGGMKVELWASHMLSQDTLSHGNCHLVFPALWKEFTSGSTKLMYFSRKITKCLEFNHTPLDNLLGKPFPEQQ